MGSAAIQLGRRLVDLLGHVEAARHLIELLIAQAVRLAPLGLLGFFARGRNLVFH